MHRTLTRISCFLLSFILLCSLVPTASAYSGAADWAKDTLATMDELGLIPDSLADADMSRDISRLDMVRSAVATFEKLTEAPIPLPDGHPFTDTTDPAAEKAYAAGLTAGKGDGTFAPDDSLTRLEFFCFAATMLEKLNFPILESDYADLSSFTDAGSIPEWGYRSTQLCIGLKIASGTGTELAWADTTARQEALCMLYRVYERVDLMEPVAPDVPNAPHEPPALIGLDEWAREKVEYLDSLGLLPPEVRSQPMNGIITRQNMCKVVMRTYKEVKGLTDADLGDPGPSPFSDTSDWDVLHAYRLGIVSGTGEGTFSPDNPISRQDFFTISASFLKAVDFPLTDAVSIKLGEHFSDAGQIASYAQAPARLLVCICQLSGSNGRLLPLDSIVAQEALVIFYRIRECCLNYGEAVADFAESFVGYPYVAAGRAPENGFDCSGFVYYIYSEFGYELLPGADNQWNKLSDEIIPRDQLRPGDLVFFSDNGAPSGISHVGLYIGDGNMVHAANPKKGVRIDPLSMDYYEERYLGAKRVLS